MNTWLTAIYIKPEYVDKFLEATSPFAEESLRESGLVSFALLQQVETSSHFSMFDVYHDDVARAAHLSSAHYLMWLEIVTPLLAEPMTPLPYLPIFPPPEDWEHHLETES